MIRLEVKSAFAVDDTGAIEAIAWPFGSPDRVGDTIERGAFKSAAAPLPMLAFHESSDPVGVWDGLTEAADGLRIKGRLLINDLPRARELHALVKAGGISGVSVGFRGLKSSPRHGGGRAFAEVDLMEVSLVSVPAHPGARITAAKSIRFAADAVRLADAINRAASALKKGA